MSEAIRHVGPGMWRRHRGSAICDVCQVRRDVMWERRIPVFGAIIRCEEHLPVRQPLTTPTERGDNDE